MSERECGQAFTGNPETGGTFPDWSCRTRGGRRTVRERGNGSGSAGWYGAASGFRGDWGAVRRAFGGCKLSIESNERTEVRRAQQEGRRARSGGRLRGNAPECEGRRVGRPPAFVSDARKGGPNPAARVPAGGPSRVRLRGGAGGAAGKRRRGRAGAPLRGCGGGGRGGRQHRHARASGGHHSGCGGGGGGSHRQARGRAGDTTSCCGDGGGCGVTSAARRRWGRSAAACRTPSACRADVARPPSRAR